MYKSKLWDLSKHLESSKVVVLNVCIATIWFICMYKPIIQNWLFYSCVLSLCFSPSFWPLLNRGLVQTFPHLSILWSCHPFDGYSLHVFDPPYGRSFPNLLSAFGLHASIVDVYLLSLSFTKWLAHSSISTLRCDL